MLGDLALAPVYDLVTTTVYIAADRMALTIAGSIQWPPAKQLRRLGKTRGMGSPRRIRQILERVADAMLDTMPAIRAYAKRVPRFVAIGERMLREWETGIATSLKEG